MQEGTAGVKHLADLHSAGLTHVHLLPSYDYGSVPERAKDQQTPEVPSQCLLRCHLPICNINVISKLHCANGQVVQSSQSMDSPRSLQCMKTPFYTFPFCVH